MIDDNVLTPGFCAPALTDDKPYDIIDDRELTPGLVTLSVGAPTIDDNP